MKTLKEIIDSSSYAVFFGGAGVSTASDIPDFRGVKGIYNTDNEFNLPPEEIISHDFFVSRTKDFYKYYRDNMVYPEAKPNIVHNALAKLEREGKIKAILTQNIDGLHQKAGSQNVYELHGSVHRNYCTRCGKSYDLDYVLKSDGVPKCDCGGIIKPDVVLYGEPLNEAVWQGAFFEVSKADTLIIGGSSLTVYPAAGLVEIFRGKNLCIINAQKTPYDNIATFISREDLSKVFKTLL